MSAELGLCWAMGSTLGHWQDRSGRKGLHVGLMCALSVGTLASLALLLRMPPRGSKNRCFWFSQGSLHQDANVLLDKADSHVLLPFACRHLYIQFSASPRQHEALQVAHWSDAAGKLPTDFSRLLLLSGIQYHPLLYFSDRGLFPYTLQSNSQPPCVSLQPSLSPTHVSPEKSCFWNGEGNVMQTEIGGEKLLEQIFPEISPGTSVCRHLGAVGQGGKWMKEDKDQRQRQADQIIACLAFLDWLWGSEAVFSLWSWPLVTLLLPETGHFSSQQMWYLGTARVKMVKTDSVRLLT